MFNLTRNCYSAVHGLFGRKDSIDFNVGLHGGANIHSGGHNGLNRRVLSGSSILTH